MEACISVGKSKQRNTNLELFRIVTMLLIIAHHYVVNSGLTGLITANPLSWRSIFLLLLGAWGKIGINCFVLITGYFMCKSNMSAKRYCKLYFEMIFYYLAVHFFFWITGYSTFSWQELLALLFPVSCVADMFGFAYLLFLLCIPFLNVLLQHLTQKMHAYLLVLTCCIYVVPETLRLFCVLEMNYVSWFMVLYILSAYVRMYPNKLFGNVKFWGILSVLCITASALSVVVCTWLGSRAGHNLSYYFVTDSNAFLALATGFCSFMFIKNARVPQSYVINKLASTCYGVLCIHTCSSTMRTWLWVDILNNVGVYHQRWMPVHAIVSVVAIFLIGAGIDILRQRYIERPFFVVWDKYWENFVIRYKAVEKWICCKLNIQES